MNEQVIIDLSSKTIWVAIKVASPALIATLVMGLIVSIFQAATQINEQTLSFIPKILAMTAALIFFGPWTLQVIMNFTTELFLYIPEITR